MLDINSSMWPIFTRMSAVPRIGRNPQTNESITIPASKVPSFKAGKTLKDAVQ